MKTNCPDCKGILRRIQIVDATELQPGGRGTRHASLEYAAENAKPSMLGSHVTTEGVVRAVICEDCKRIFLYGEETNG